MNSNFKRTVLIAMVICVGLAGVSPAAAEIMEKYRARKGLKTADKKRPTAMELVDQYAATQEKIYKSFVMKFEASIEGYKSWSNILEGGKRKGGVDSEIRFDGKRFYWSGVMWANCYPDVKTFIPRNDPRAKWDLWYGSAHYHGGNAPYKLMNELADARCKTAK